MVLRHKSTIYIYVYYNTFTSRKFQENAIIHKLYVYLYLLNTNSV